MDLPVPPEVLAAVGTLWKSHHLKPIQSWGENGIVFASTAPGNDLVVIVSVNATHPDIEGTWHHLSASHKGRMPGHLEMAWLKEVFFPGQFAIAVYAPKARHVNLAQNALHLWVRADKPACPDFSIITGIV